MNIRNKQKAFTLIELLVVIAIIGILSGVVIVSISGLQESARDSRIKSEMNQLRTVAEIYKASHSGDYTGLTDDSQISDLLEDITLQGGTAESNLFTSSNSFCVFSLLAGSDESWCIDSLGYSGTGTCTNYQCNYDESSWSGGTLAEGLVGYWTMDQSDSSGSTLFDQSPYGNDGTIYGATFTTDRKGKANSAMSFNGSSDYVDCGNDDSLNNLNIITFSAWINANNYGGGGSGRLYDKSKNLLHINIGGIYFYSYWTGTGAWYCSMPSLNEWNHIVLIYDRSSASNSPLIYINGESVSVATISAPTGTVGDDSSYDLIIGNNASITRTFEGSIDDVRIYNRTLSQDEITLLYNQYNPKIIL